MEASGLPMPDDLVLGGLDNMRPCYLPNSQ